MAPTLVLRLDVDLAPTDRGGRRRPVTDGYRASLSFGRRRRDVEPVVHDAILVLEQARELPPGQRAVARAWVVSPDELPRSLKDGAVVTLLENDRIVGRARVLERLEDHVQRPLEDLPAARVRRLGLPSRPEMANADKMLDVAASRADELAAPGLNPRPRRKVAVLACMDTRIDLFPMLGIERGDAHIIRNAGGLVTDDAIRSLSASQRLLGTEEIVVVMHDGCGLHGASEDGFRQSLAADGVLPTWRLGAFDDIEGTLHNSLARLRSSPELSHRDRVRGFIFDPETGRLREGEPRPAEGAPEG